TIQLEDPYLAKKVEEMLPNFAVQEKIREDLKMFLALIDATSPMFDPVKENAMWSPALFGGQLMLLYELGKQFEKGQGPFAHRPPAPELSKKEQEEFLELTRKLFGRGSEAWWANHTRQERDNWVTLLKTY